MAGETQQKCMAKWVDYSGFGVRLKACPFNIYQIPSFMLNLVLGAGDTALNDVSLNCVGSLYTRKPCTTVWMSSLLCIGLALASLWSLALAEQDGSSCPGLNGLVVLAS